MMMENNPPRLMLAGTGSGCGKTTLTCALLRAMQNRGLKAVGFKAGPDYIDPMFHAKIVGGKSHNLDLFLCGEAAVKQLFSEGSDGADFSLIEGAMGLYDGLGSSADCSANALSLLTETPVILVLSPQGMSLSAAAVVKGFLDFKGNNIAGVILNKVSKKTYEFYREILEREAKIHVCGYLPDIAAAAFDSRHLGLVTAAEILDLRERVALLAEAVENSVDIDGLLKLGAAAKPFTTVEMPPARTVDSVRIGIARDTAFCFYYDESLAVLEQLGAQLVYFSPLSDMALPEGLSGLILGGGYPEEHSAGLAENVPLLSEIKRAAASGMPIIAEGGGFIYLSKTLADRQGNTHAMAGVINTKITMTKGLSKFGYVTLTAKKDNLLCKAGEEIPAHEFHYSESTDDGNAFIAEKISGKTWETIHASDTIFAGYPHLHLCGNLQLAERFLKKCRGYLR